MAAGEQDAGHRLRNLLFSAEQNFNAATAASAGEHGSGSQRAAAESSLLQLHSLLSVTARQAPASRHQADGLLQQCVSRLHKLSVQQHKSAARCDAYAIGCRRVPFAYCRSTRTVATSVSDFKPQPCMNFQGCLLLQPAGVNGWLSCCSKLAAQRASSFSTPKGLTWVPS